MGIQRSLTPYEFRWLQRKRFQDRTKSEHNGPVRRRISFGSLATELRLYKTALRCVGTKLELCPVDLMGKHMSVFHSLEKEALCTLRWIKKKKKNRKKNRVTQCNYNKTWAFPVGCWLPNKNNKIHNFFNADVWKIINICRFDKW